MAFIVMILITREKAYKGSQILSKDHIFIKTYDPRVWPFLVVSAAFGICNAALVQTSSFYFQDVIVPFSENYIAIASAGDVVGRGAIHFPPSNCAVSLK